MVKIVGFSKIFTVRLSKPNLCKLLQFCTLVNKRDISFGVVSLKSEICGDFLLPLTRLLLCMCYNIGDAFALL